ncbi:unnamed protein product [marine sediment metagenome]|uniref:Uncharacterized protein n=1 Tax=marine sediment metagenome TaxID=412755 RepID=X1BJ57_9ZZZZ
MKTFNISKKFTYLFILLILIGIISDIYNFQKYLYTLSYPPKTLYDVSFLMLCGIAIFSAVKSLAKKYEKRILVLYGLAVICNGIRHLSAINNIFVTINLFFVITIILHIWVIISCIQHLKALSSEKGTGIY